MEIVSLLYFVRRKNFEIQLFDVYCSETCMGRRFIKPEMGAQPSLGKIGGNVKIVNNNPVYKTAKETMMYRTVLWTLLERERVGRFERMALKHV